MSPSAAAASNRIKGQVSVVAFATALPAVVVLTWTGCNNEEPDSSEPIRLATYTATIFSKPVLRQGGTPADDLCEATENALHNWQAGRDHCYYHAHYLSTSPIDHDELLVHQINFNVKI